MFIVEFLSICRRLLNFASQPVDIGLRHLILGPYFFFKKRMDYESQRPLLPSNPLKWVPVVSVFIGLAALGFQVFVLFPWHIQLSNEFAELQRNCLIKGSGLN